MLFGIFGGHADQFAPPTAAHQQYPAIFEDVEDHHRTGQAQYHALLALQCGRIQGPIHARFAGREPDLLAIGRPRKTLDSEPFARQVFLLASQIDDRERTAVITLDRVIDECDEVSFGGNTWMADPPTGLIQWLSDRVFKPVTATQIADHGKAVSVRGPVRPLHMLQHFARRAPDQRSPRQRAHVHPGPNRFAVQQDGHLRRGRYRHQLGPTETHGTRLGSFSTRGKYIYLTALPAR